VENILDRNGYKPYNGKWRKIEENGGRRLGILSEWEEITPLGGGSKISEEDPPL